MLATIATVLLVAGCGGDGDTTVVETTTVTETVAVPPEPEPTTPVEPPQPQPEPPSGGRRDCGQVAFEPNTDAGAFGITANATDCDTARAVAAAAEGRGQRYTARGFTCTGTPREGPGLATVEWECTSGEQLVTFETS